MFHEGLEANPRVSLFNPGISRLSPTDSQLSKKQCLPIRAIWSYLEVEAELRLCQSYRIWAPRLWRKCKERIEHLWTTELVSLKEFNASNE